MHDVRVVTGLFDIPTPFMKLSVKKYCLPDFMVLTRLLLAKGITLLPPAPIGGVFSYMGLVPDPHAPAPPLSPSQASPSPKQLTFNSRC